MSLTDFDFSSIRDAIANVDTSADFFNATNTDALDLVTEWEDRLKSLALQAGPSVKIQSRFGRKPIQSTDPLLTRTKQKCKRTQKLIATLDFETDPFARDEMVAPFCWDVYDGASHTTFWNKFDEAQCVPKLIEFLSELREPHLIYAHNGGKFDFMFLLKYIAGDMLIINGRIVSAHIGKHEIRDSYAALPVALKEYGKDEFDYATLKKDVRVNHYDSILKYLRNDCEYLYKLILAYHAEFGNVKTMASAAMREFKKFYTFESCNENSDANMRKFYYGGRVQCFQSGIVKGKFQIYDVNSMYPYAMKAFKHPISDASFVTSMITKRSYFVEVTGRNYGAFPCREKNGSLSFAKEHGTFYVSIHEYNAALETGTFKPEKIHCAYNYTDVSSFDEFIDHFYEARLAADERGDQAHKLFYKLVMNSCYGKLAQDPREFKDYEFRSFDNAPAPLCTCDMDSQPRCTCGGWSFELSNDKERWRLWYRHPELKAHSFYNVATAASITGAARSLLLRGIVNSKNPIYCDTDSLICESISNVHIDSKALGAWKLEKTGTLAAIAGKKLYAVFEGEECVKMASKGCRISPAEIIEICNGGEIEYAALAPSFKLDGSQVPLKRTIRRT